MLNYAILLEKHFFYEALTCSGMLGIVDPFLEKIPFAWFLAVEILLPS